MKVAQRLLPMTRGTSSVVLAITLGAMFGSAVMGHVQQTQDVTAPPPVKVISSHEREQLNDSKDPKARVKMSIILAESHLESAEIYTAQQAYDNASGEAARYWAIIENALAYLRPMKSDSNKTRDLYKRLELALRAHGPRLSALRRSTPQEYAVWIKEFEESARNGRTEALNSFYGQTVVRDSQRNAVEQKPSEKPLQESSAGPRLKPL
jgi:hypothetical protein